MKIPHERGLLGHSDADALAHALCDALLGAVADGDIGRHFPDSDERYKGADSAVLLAEAYKKAKAEGYIIANLDCTIIAQKPKLEPHIGAMRAKIAAVLETAEANVNVKATTEEGLGFTGAMQGIAAHCVCLLEDA